jgi:hypothetical protein
MLELTKFLCLHDELFSQHIPIRDDALTWIHLAFQVDVLSMPEVISSGIDGIGSLNCIPLESVFRILVIDFINSSTCLSMKTQKDPIDEATVPIPLRLKIQICGWIEQWRGVIGLQ